MHHGVEATPLHYSSYQSGQDISEHPRQLAQQQQSSPPPMLASLEQQQLALAQRQRLEMEQLHQRHRLQEQHQEQQQATTDVKSDTVNTRVWWTDEMLEMTNSELNAFATTTPGLAPGEFDRLKLARKRKRNRVYAKRSRRRRKQAKLGDDKPISWMYSEKISTLQNANTAVRLSLSSHA
jgi:hypothetical protein